MAAVWLVCVRGMRMRTGIWEKEKQTMLIFMLGNQNSERVWRKKCRPSPPQTMSSQQPDNNNTPILNTTPRQYWRPDNYYSIIHILYDSMCKLINLFFLNHLLSFTFSRFCSLLLSKIIPLDVRGVNFNVFSDRVL